MTPLVVGEDHALAMAFRALVPATLLAPWGPPAGEPPAADALIFAPDPWYDEPTDPAAVIDDLAVLHAWLHEWVPLARERGSGALLYVTRVNGVFGHADHVLLAERDSAMLAQARAMAMELGRFGIRSNCLALGPLGNPGDTDEELTANPLRRIGTWADAATTAAFLIGDAAAHLTGQLLVCAGGADVGRLVP